MRASTLALCFLASLSQPAWACKNAMYEGGPDWNDVGWMIPLLLIGVVVIIYVVRRGTDAD